MKTCIALLLVLLGPASVRAQSASPVDCNCLTNLPVLATNACQAVIPDLCLLATNCFSRDVVIGSPGYCNQTPPAGTPVGPGVHWISLTVLDNQGLGAQCVVPFTVTPGPGCALALLCASNKTVECGSAWTFDPPTWTNACAPPLGTISNGVVLAVVSTVTNGFCPQVITRTWQGVDDCGYHDQCSQTVTVVDTTPPMLDCRCLTNNPAVPLTVVACASAIPDLCLPASLCGTDNCGPLNCSQTPAAGTPVGVGIHPITVTLTDCASNTTQCVVSFTVVAPTGGCCVGVPVLRLFSGATNNTSGVLPAGALDTQFLTGPPLFSAAHPAVPGIINGWWLPNTAQSKWIGPSSNYVLSPPGVFLYTNRFYLCSTSQVQLSGRWTADDTGRILLNGAPTANVLPNGWAFTNWHPVSITSGFVPGWNELVFAVTNGGYSVTGLRTEITGTACCSPCVTIACAPDIITNSCAGGVVAQFAAPTAASACGAIVSATCSPPSGSFFPVGTNTVVCTAIDAQGNAATCSFKVIVQATGGPGVVVQCPGDQTVYTCGSNAVAFWNTSATGHTGPVVCTPPSGSAFPLGTNLVTCRATNLCGQAAICSFTVIVKPLLQGPPSLTLTAGLPDNFAPPVDPASTNACLVSAFGGYPLWKGFDDPKINWLFGHRFAGLPNNVAKAELVVRMKPGDNSGSTNDGLFIGLPACAFSNFIWSASIQTLPGAGGWLANQPAVTFTLDLGALNPALLAHINTFQRLDVAVHDDTTVDYMQLRLWRCPPPRRWHGLPVLTALGSGPAAAIAAMPVPDLPAFGPIGNGPAISLSPPEGNPALPGEAQIGLGGAQAFSITAILDMNAPEGAEIVISQPTEDGTNAPLLTLVKAGCLPRCHWDIKTNKKFSDAGGECRVSAVNQDGELLGSFTASEAEVEAEGLLALSPEPGVDQFPLSILFDAATGEITLTFPGTVERRLCNGLPCPRGWDGTIKGRATEKTRRRGWDGVVKCPCYDQDASRIVITPLAGPQPLPLESLVIGSIGLADLVLAAPHFYTAGGEVAPADQKAVMLQGAGGAGFDFSALDDYSGVVLDLGRTSSFDLGILPLSDVGLPGGEHVFRFGGPRWPPGTTTNRPPPPVFDARLAPSAQGVEISADFSPLGAVGITVHLLSNGVLAAVGSTPGPVIFPDEPLVLDRWPDQLGLMGTNAVLRLASTEMFVLQGLIGDELRLIPELPADGPPYEFSGQIQWTGGGGAGGLLFLRERQTSAQPGALGIHSTAAGLAIEWSGEGCRLLGAETPTGPWLELGVDSPFTPPPKGPQRFFRLICE